LRCAIENFFAVSAALQQELSLASSQSAQIMSDDRLTVERSRAGINIRHLTHFAIPPCALCFSAFENYPIKYE
jgi:hypothetical protein